MGTEEHLRDAEVAARALGVQLQSLEIRPPFDFENAFRAAEKGRAEALIVVSAGLGAHRAQVITFTARKRLPLIASSRTWVRAGGLMSYSPNRAEQQRRAAVYVDKILKGAKPGDLPVERATAFELVINLKTAKQIGVTIPPEILLQATKVIK